MAREDIVNGDAMGAKDLNERRRHGATERPVSAKTDFSPTQSLKPSAYFQSEI